MATSAKQTVSGKGRSFQAGTDQDMSTEVPMLFRQSATEAAGASEAFSQLYLLTVDPKTGHTSVAFGESPNETVTLAHGSTLFGGEHFTVSGAPHNDGTYSYIGEAKVGGNVIGFTAFNSNGQEILFSNDANLNFGSSVTVLDGIDTSICFTAGTNIATPSGQAKVETLKIGDMVLTVDDESKPVKWIGIQTVSSMFSDPSRVRPIRILAGALGDNMPMRDLRVSPDHALLIDETLVHASALVNGTTIAQETSAPDSFVYYHVELHDHSLILAEGVPAETFVDNVERLGFDNWAEHEALYPDAPGIAEMDRPRAKSHRQVPYSVRTVVAERASLLSGSAERAA